MENENVSKWVRNNGDILEIVDFDPTGKWGDGIPFVPVIGPIEKYLDINYKVFDGEVQPPSIDYLKKQIIDQITAERYMVECRGLIMPDGTVIKTDRESQSQINSAFNSLSNGFITETEWKTDTNQFVTVNLEQITVIGKAVAEHVSKCFNTEKVKCLEVMALDNVNDLLAYKIEDGWPNYIAPEDGQGQVTVENPVLPDEEPNPLP